MDQTDRSPISTEDPAVALRLVRTAEVYAMNSKTAKIFVGMDISKGYADLHAVNTAGSVLGKDRFDDTRPGHDAVCVLLKQWLAALPEDSIVVGVEASGGLERNWVHTLRALDPRVTVAVLNPLAVKRFLAQELHRSVTDPISAAGIARYLASGQRLHQLRHDPALEGMQELYHCACAAIERMAKTKNQLQSLLPRVHPDLVQFTRESIPQWVLGVLERYPTAEKLARAKRAGLMRISRVTTARADALIADARQSVAAQADPYTAHTIAFLAREIAHQMETVRELQKTLGAALRDDPGVRMMKSIHGIGEWSAISLRIEIGLIERFRSPEALTAYAGLDPRYHQSGDSIHTMHISKHGRRRIRALLYMCALTAVRDNPTIRIFYERLVGRGKPTKVAQVAAMRKLLHLIYACWMTETPYDAQYETRRRAERAKQTASSGTQTAEEQSDHGSKEETIRITAPVTRREAKRRKAAAVPQTRLDVHAWSWHCPSPSEIRG
jgi:transposase